MWIVDYFKHLKIAWLDIVRVFYRKAAKPMLRVEKHMEKEEKCGASFISSYSL